MFVIPNVRYSEGSLFRIEHKVRYSESRVTVRIMVRIMVRIRIRVRVRIRVRIRNDEPYALFGITDLCNNEPSSQQAFVITRCNQEDNM